PFDELGDIRILERKLERGAGAPAADGDILRRLEEQIDSRDLCELWPQAIDDPRCVEVAFLARLEHNGKIPGVRGLRAAGGADRGTKPRHGRVAHDHFTEFALQTHHLLRRGVLRALGYAVDQADILDRKKSLWYGN